MKYKQQCWQNFDHAHKLKCSLPKTKKKTKTICLNKKNPIQTPTAAVKYRMQNDGPWPRGRLGVLICHFRLSTLSQGGGCKATFDVWWATVLCISHIHRYVDHWHPLKKISLGARPSLHTTT